MREKTAEEKLREELEGDLPGKKTSKQPRAKKFSKASGIGRKADSFIDDFERRIEQSLSTGNIFRAPSEVRHEKKKQNNEAASAVKKQAVHEPVKSALDTEHSQIPSAEPLRADPVQLKNSIAEPLRTEPEQDEIPAAEPSQVSPQPENPIADLAQVEAVQPELPFAELEQNEVPDEASRTETIQQEVPVSEPVQFANPASETLQTGHIQSEAPIAELKQPEVPIVEPVQIEPEQDEVPVAEPLQTEFEQQEVPIVEPEAAQTVEPLQEEPEIVPEIEPYEEAETEIEESELPIIDAETDDGELPDIPVIEPDDDTQDISAEEDEFENSSSDGELPDIPIIEDDTDDEEFNEQESSSQPADIVVSVDDELPDLSEDLPDPEAEAAPVTVTMPESTKTAEDKLMADIAEAMTGSPLNLDSPEAPTPYQLPDNFFNPDIENADPSQQSAEEKLIANIAQAMNESPLDTAQAQARQDLEQDLNPFEELSLPASVEEPEEPEAIENAEEEQALLPDFSDDVQEETEAPETLTLDEEPDPFTLNNAQDDLNTEENINESIEEESDEEARNEEAEPEKEENSELENDNIHDEDNEILQLSPEEAISFLDDDDDENNEPQLKEFIAPIENNEILTEEQRLQQEVAKLTQAEPEININLGKEEQPENKMPEQSLLNDDTELTQDVDDDGDDWDISSLGALSEATSIPDDEPEDIIPSETPTSIIMSNPEQAEQEKTMNIREKLAERKNKAPAGAKKSSPSAPTSSSSSASGGRGGFLLPLLLGLLLLLGGVIAWQLHQISDKMTLAMMNSGSFENIAGFEVPPSYDYAIDFILDPNINERMAARGREGWQVVGSRRTQDSTTGQYGYEFIFMRKISGR